jgi:serine protease
MLILRRIGLAACATAALLALSAGSAASGTLDARAAATAAPAAYVPDEVVVGYAQRPTTSFGTLVRRLGIRTQAEPGPSPTEQVLRLPSGLSVAAAAAWLQRQPGVTYAVPNFIAHAAGAFYPNDPGKEGRPGGWENLQWNFLSGAGVNAPEAWANLIADHRPGGRGVTVAILDTGVAYRDWRAFRRSPDFAGTRFVDPHDFVAGNRYPLDREGHGTFVAGTVAEETNNGIGVTGLAYGASIMPVRILNANGTGDASTISRGIRYAASHGAQVINLSLEFSLAVSAGDIPDIISALRYAHNRGVVVVASAGNEGVNQVAYPARASDVISVGASTSDRCLADYSNAGSRLDLVAPGGDADSSAISDPDCHPQRSLPDIFQETFFAPSDPRRFGLPGGWYGTSMSAPHVAAAAALVIASGVLGRHPSPDAVLARLEATAQALGGSKPNSDYGYGLVDAGAATTATGSVAAHH